MDEEVKWTVNFEICSRDCNSCVRHAASLVSLTTYLFRSRCERHRPCKGQLADTRRWCLNSKRYRFQDRNRCRRPGSRGTHAEFHASLGLLPAFSVKRPAVNFI